FNDQVMSNNFINSDMSNLWNNSAHLPNQMNEFANTGHLQGKIDVSGNFFANLTEGQNCNKIEFTPPSIVISNTDFNDRQSTDAQNGNQFSQPVVPNFAFEEPNSNNNNKSMDNNGVIVDDV